MSNPNQHPVEDGPSKSALSLALFHFTELKDAEVSFFHRPKSPTFRNLVGGSFRWGKNKRGLAETQLQIRAVSPEDGSAESWMIEGYNSDLGKVEIYFRTDSREGWIRFLDLDCS